MDLTIDYVDEDENQFTDEIKGNKTEGEALGKTLALKMKGMKL